MAGVGSIKSQEDQLTSEAGASPRPHTREEIIEMMDAAAAKARKTAKPTDGILNTTSFWLLWAGVFVALAAIVYVLLSASDAGGAGIILAGGLALLIAVFLTGAGMKMFSPVLVTGMSLRRTSGKRPGGVELAGAEILGALGLAERVLDGDADGRLVARRDGVVTYANKAYFALAKQAGVMGPAGLPPRIDRLFAQQGVEATKLFRLCKAAKSGDPAEEVIYQTIGLAGGGERRRFEVSVRPIKGADDYVVWRLRELPVEEDKHDALAAAYADLPRPVFALEKSGQIAWTNAALRDKLGASRGELQSIDDVILGETRELVSTLWRIDRTETKAQVRRRDADPAEAVFSAFRRGGVGEGFACVEMVVDEAADKVEDVKLSGDISESPFGVAIIEGEINRDGRIVEANKAFTDAFSAEKKNTPLAKCVNAVALEDIADEIRRKSRSGGSPKPVETTIGEGVNARTFALYARPVRRKRGSYGVRRTLLYTVDVTDRKQMEEEYAQDQKLRGIGELASKVAHDFNNYLQVVIGHCERLMLKHPAGDPAYQDLVQIRENAQRAANTTKQLLAFSRKQTLKKEVLSITELLRDFSPFLNRSIGEKVKLELINGRALPTIRVDKHQLETAIMNLAVNARDAMAPKGGILTVRTQFLSGEEATGRKVQGLSEQDYVLLEVSDNGPGVPAELIDKIFDPFFTTKESGKGTGLGLSTVYGIVRQLEGVIALKSEPGKGATFEIYLPAYEEDQVEASSQEASKKITSAPARREPQDLTGAGRILVVEDEDPVRAFVVATLTDCGYEVTQAEDGEDALDILEEDTDFDLVISDVMMPDLDGPSMIAQARKELDLGSKVIFMSAYAEAAVRDQLDIIDGAGYIQKPFTLQGIAVAVKDTLFPPDEA
ncbi:ATP-binding protein [Hyphococcus flavus]|uniref:histidine kinase n=1 Tax=Hyphococcus flavus TaxID=1866326 RepID=A0AAE9ZD45_9PROT|nr:PAS domain-containing sensor histidine kinase [Hyphococcus flavus]WDI32798.1 ATP-binding protein [Hyphococcus flavus]